ITLQCKVKGHEKSTPRSLSLTGRPDERFHVVEVALERAPSGRRQAILGLRQAPLEGLRARDVLGVLELARVDAEVPVGRLQELLEIVERERLVDREGADDAETHPFVDEPVELGSGRGGPGVGPLPRRTRGVRSLARLAAGAITVRGRMPSHRASWR